MAENRIIQRFSQSALSVIWLGGAPDSGKSTLARKLGRNYPIRVYHCDHYESDHLKRLAQSYPKYERFLEMSAAERWKEPDEMFHWLIHLAIDRLPLILDDLLNEQQNGVVLVEGFCLLPSLIVPLQQNQAVWLLPTDDFQRRRKKPIWPREVGDAETAENNLNQLRKLLTKYVQHQTVAYNVPTMKIDGRLPISTLVARLAQYFQITVSA